MSLVRLSLIGLPGGELVQVIKINNLVDFHEVVSYVAVRTGLGTGNSASMVSLWFVYGRSMLAGTFPNVP